MLNKSYKIYPYLSAEHAFLGFIEDFNEFNKNNPGKVYLRTGPKNPTSGLRPREILCLTIIANVAMFESGDQWVPGWLVDTNGNDLPENIAHDGIIRCVSGSRKGAFMHFEQAMATEVASDATPQEIEAAILKEANRKSSKGTEYVGGMALIIFVDYSGELSDLRKLSNSIYDSSYKTIYLIASLSGKIKDFVCVTLKNPADTHGPMSVKFDRPDGKANVARMGE